MAGQVFQGAEGFLGHSSSSGSGGFLKNWKDEGELDIVLHPKSGIAALWAHRWHRIDKDKEGKPRIFPMRFNSMETEAVLKRQHFRNGDGSREYPPVCCPFSLTLEWVREMIESGDIDWTDEIFKFETPKEDAIIHAGGFCNLFGKRDLDDDQLAELKKARIDRRNAFKENGGCKLSYVFGVIQYQLPDEGALIAMEGKALGDKMKKAIRDETSKWKKSATPLKGDPFANPYVFRWTYDESKDFDDAYDVVAMPTESLPITADILAVIDEPPPSMENIIAPSNVALLRASFEEHWVHAIVPPWDELFAAAERMVKGTPAAVLPSDERNERDERKEEKRPAQPSSKKEAPPPPANDDIECDVCHKGMKDTEFTCPHCGTEYDPDTGLVIPKPEPVKEEPKRRTRSEAKSESAAASGKKELEAEKPKRSRGA